MKATSNVWYQLDASAFGLRHSRALPLSRPAFLYGSPGTCQGTKCELSLILLSELKRNSFNETNEDDRKDNSDISSFSGYLPEQISSISQCVFLVSFLQDAEKKAHNGHNGMGLTSCVRAEICQLWQLQLITGRGQELPKKDRRNGGVAFIPIYFGY